MNLQRAILNMRLSTITMPLTFFKWSPPSDILLTYFLTFHLAYVSGISSDILSGILRRFFVVLALVWTGGFLRRWRSSFWPPIFPIGLHHWPFNLFVGGEERFFSFAMFALLILLFSFVQRACSWLRFFVGLCALTSF